MSALFGRGLFAKIIFADQTDEGSNILDGTVWVDACPSISAWNNSAINISSWNTQAVIASGWDNITSDKPNRIRCIKR